MRGIIMLFVVVVVAGCGHMAGSSVYRAKHPLTPIGYRDKLIGEGVWEVTYDTEVTDNARYAHRYARYRAAELARDAGFPFFYIARGETRWTTGLSVSTTEKLIVHGARSWSDEQGCERRVCEKYATDAALREFEPVKRHPARPRADPQADTSAQAPSP